MTQAVLPRIGQVVPHELTVGQETLRRFGWPAVSASEVRAKWEALGAEMEARENAV
ncbi:MAG: hypothetical protein ACRDGS_15435 [Chloroflexota bacterium]